jgi:hypothetical protein
LLLARSVKTIALHRGYYFINHFEDFALPDRILMLRAYQLRGTYKVREDCSLSQDHFRPFLTIDSIFATFPLFADGTSSSSASSSSSFL